VIADNVSISTECINAWNWNEWLWACLWILWSNRNLVGSNALPSAATIAETENGKTLNLNPKQAKTETKNGTTLILNLKKAETESENGKREIHTTWRFMPRTKSNSYDGA
jgi:hypothetical protein